MITVRINGKCNAKDKIGGWSASFDHHTIVGGAANTTHQRMELTALLEAIKTIRKQPEKTELRIVTRNTYIPNAMKNFASYQANGFRSSGNTPIRNLDLWDKIIREATSRNVIISIPK